MIDERCPSHSPIPYKSDDIELRNNGAFLNATEPITDSRKVIPCNKTAPFPLVMVGDMIFYDGSGKGMANECVFAQGLAVLLYIEDKNGWAK